MRIGELAKLAGVTVRAVRYYHQKHLLAEPERRANGYRDYTVDHLVALIRLRQLTESGLSLEHAGAIISDAASPTDEALDEVDAVLGQRIAALTSQRERLAEARADGRVGLSKLAAALATAPADTPISTLFAHLYADDERARQLADTMNRPEVRSKVIAAQESFYDVDESTSAAELDELATEFACIAKEFLPDAPMVTDEQSRLLLTLAERDHNDVQQAFIRRLTFGVQEQPGSSPG